MTREGAGAEERAKALNVERCTTHYANSAPFRAWRYQCAMCIADEIRAAEAAATAKERERCARLAHQAELAESQNSFAAAKALFKLCAAIRGGDEQDGALQVLNEAPKGER